MPNKSSSSVRVWYPRHNREKLLADIRERLPDLAAALPLERVVLFGSWAAGRATAASDIDLLIVYGDPPKADAYRTVRRIMRLPGLEPHIYSTTEASELPDTIERMTREGVVLW